MINRYVVNTISDKTGKLVCYETVRTKEDALRVVKRYAAIKGITNKVVENKQC
jgi:hypothetical protein